MKKICYTLAFLALPFFGCKKVQQFSPKPILTARSEVNTGIVLVYDLSLSDTFLKPDESTLANLLMQYAFDGVCMTCLHILPDSRQQQPWLSPIVNYDTLPLPGNFILAARQLKRNQESLLKAQTTSDTVAKMVSARIFLEQQYHRSDVEGALRLAAMTAQGYANKHIKPIVIIVSDMLQDITPGAALETIQAMDFPPNTEVIVIGADVQVVLKTIFVNVKIRELPSFQHLMI